MKQVIDFLASKGFEQDAGLVKFMDMFNYEDQSDLDPHYDYETIVLLKDDKGFFIHTLIVSSDEIRFSDPDVDQIGGEERTIYVDTVEAAIEYFDSVAESIWRDGYIDE